MCRGWKERSRSAEAVLGMSMSLMSDSGDDTLTSFSSYDMMGGGWWW